jgi:hypothetical protein
MSGDLKVGNNSFLGANTVISSDYIYGTITGFRNIVLPLTTNPVLTGRNISGNNNIIIGSVLTSNSGNIILGRGAGKLILESGDPGSGETAFPARILNQASSEVSFNVEQASSGILTITSPGSFTNVPTNGSGFSAASTSQTFTLTHVNCKSNDIILLTVRRLSGGTNIGFGAMLLNITEDVNGGNITFKFTSNADATDTDASLPDLTLYWVVIGTTGSLT